MLVCASRFSELRGFSDRTWYENSLLSNSRPSLRKMLISGTARAYSKWLVRTVLIGLFSLLLTLTSMAFAVNCEGAIHVAQAARKAGSRLLLLSTDYVFDGTKRTPYEITDAKSPTSVYGESKARAEEGVLEILPEACIARTSWLFGRGGKCFPATILKLALTRPELSVVNDQRGSPTFTGDLASALAQLCRVSAEGIVHITNSGNCTWFDFASEILRQSGSLTKVKPVTTAEFPRPAKRPAYSVLSPDSLHAYNIQMREWRDALHSYLSTAPSLPPLPPDRERRFGRGSGSRP